MSNIFTNIRRIGLLFLCMAVAAVALGCSSDAGPEPQYTAAPEEVPAFRDNTPLVQETSAPGETVYENDVFSMDVSRTNLGYVVLTYKGTNEKVKFQIAAPNEVTYTYLINQYNKPTVVPLTGGSGS